MATASRDGGSGGGGGRGLEAPLLGDGTGDVMDNVDEVVAPTAANGLAGKGADDPRGGKASGGMRKRRIGADGSSTKPPAASLGTPAPTVVESAQYDPPDSMVAEAATKQKSAWVFHRKTFLRWVFNFAIAVFVALTAVGTNYVTNALSNLRFTTLTTLVQGEQGGRTPFGVAVLGFAALSVGYAAVAAIPVAWIEPVAAGSGISEVKCVLNGILLPRVVRFKTLLVKVFGICFSVASGLPVGREGPMIHTGAIVASGLTQGKSTTLGFDTRWSVYNEFRNDKEKRDFVACGAAAGVAAAFGAPLGGVLFAIEEGASHWHRLLVWRTFFCAIATTWVLQIFLGGVNGQWGVMSSAGIFSFGSFTTTGSTSLTWSAWELPFFMLLGSFGGLFGAAFSAAQRWITLRRYAYIPSSAPLRRLVEVSIIVFTKICIDWIATVRLSQCKPIPPGGTTTKYEQLYCPDGEYDQTASLFLLPSEDAIRNMFHSNVPYGAAALICFFCTYATFMCCTYGTAVPSGLFIPALLSGAAVGRLLGEVLTSHLPATLSISPGVYALVGAAALLGGVTRMTISLAVILLECTGTYEYALPITSALLVARFVGNWFNEGIYDLHIHLRHWPLLHDHLPKVFSKGLRVSDIMTQPVVTLPPVAVVQDIVRVLSTTQHNLFPVVASGMAVVDTTSDGEVEEGNKRGAGPLAGTLVGAITRHDLCVLLAHRAFDALDAPVRLHRSRAGVPMAPSTMIVAGTLYNTRRRSQFSINATSGLDATGLTAGLAGSGAMNTGHRGGSGVERLSATLLSTTAWREAAALHSPTQCTCNTTPLHGTCLCVCHRQPGNRASPTAAAVAMGGGDARGSRGDVVAAIHGSLLGVEGVASHGVDEVHGGQAQWLLSAANLAHTAAIPQPILDTYYPHYPPLDASLLSAEDQMSLLDLRPYLDRTPYLINMHTPLRRAFDLFRGLGLRHLIVTNQHNMVVGMLTRYEFLEDFLRERLAASKAAAAGATLAARSEQDGGGDGQRSVSGFRSPPPVHAVAAAGAAASTTPEGATSKPLLARVSSTTLTLPGGNGLVSGGTGSGTTLFLSDGRSTVPRNVAGGMVDDAVLTRVPSTSISPAPMAGGISRILGASPTPATRQPSTSSGLHAYAGLTRSGTTASLSPLATTEMGGGQGEDDGLQLTLTASPPPAAVVVRGEGSSGVAAPGSVE